VAARSHAGSALQPFRAAAVGSLLEHPLAAEVLLGGQRVVRPTTEGQIVDGVRAAAGVGLEMVELQPAAFAAALAARVDIAAASGIALPDSAAHCSRYVAPRRRGVVLPGLVVSAVRRVCRFHAGWLQPARVRWHCRLGHARSLASSELSGAQLLDQRLQCAALDFDQVAIGDAVLQEVSGFLEQVDVRLIRSELHSVARAGVRGRWRLRSRLLQRLSIGDARRRSGLDVGARFRIGRWRRLLCADAGSQLSKRAREAAHIGRPGVSGSRGSRAVDDRLFELGHARVERFDPRWRVRRRRQFGHQAFDLAQC